jgi:hypothetical protein
MRAGGAGLPALDPFGGVLVRYALIMALVLPALGILFAAPARAGGPDPAKASLVNATTTVCGSAFRKYWPRVKAAAERIYSGANVDVTLNTGVRRVDAEEEPYAEVELKVPFFSASERRKRSESKMAFLRRAAKILRQLDAARRKLRVLAEKEQVMRQTMIQAGKDGIDAYFKIRERQSKLRARVEMCERRIEAMIAEGL